MRKPPVNAKNAKCYRPTDRPVRRNLGPSYCIAQPAHLPVRVLFVLSFKHRESGFLYRVSFQYSFNQGHSMDSAIV